MLEGVVYIYGVSASFLVKHFPIGLSVKKRAVLAIAAGIKEITQIAAYMVLTTSNIF